MNLFVSNIDYRITEEELNEIFSEYGTVESLIILKDLKTQKSKGYGYVLMSSSYEGQKAIIRLHRRKINDRPISVVEARPRPGNAPVKRGKNESESQVQERKLRPRRNRISPDND